MPRVVDTAVPLAGLTLLDARTSAPVDLDARPGRWLLSLIRHRY